MSSKTVAKKNTTKPKAQNKQSAKLATKPRAPPKPATPKPKLVTIERVRRDGTTQPRAFTNGVRYDASAVEDAKRKGSFAPIIERLKAAGLSWAASELERGTQAAFDNMISYLSTGGMSTLLQAITPGHALAEYARVAQRLAGSASAIHEAAIQGEIPGKKSGVAAGLEYLANQFADSSPAPAMTAAPTGDNGVGRASTGLVSAPMTTGASLKGFNPVAKAVNTPFGPGMELMCQMPLAQVRTDGVGNMALSAYGTTTLNGAGNGIEIGPDAFGDRLAAFAALYTRWKFVHARFKYTASCPTTTAGSVIIGVASDPDSTVTVNVASLMQLQPSALCPVWQGELDLDTYTDTSDNWYYTDAGSTGAEPRFESCGEVFMTVTGAPPSTSLGILWVCIKVILAGPCPDNGITVAAHVLRARPEANLVFERLMSDANWAAVLEALQIPAELPQIFVEGFDPELPPFPQLAPKPPNIKRP